MNGSEPKLGISGRIARHFQNSQLTPLLAILGLILGLFAAVFTPREEEPQINVTMANVFVPFPGADVADVENLVTVPMEQVLGEIEGVEHIYSVSRPGMSVLTVQYKVGVPRTEALVRLYNAIYSNQDWRPQNLGVMSPLVKPKGIDDVPIVSLTLWAKDSSKGAFELKQIAHSLESELKRIPGTRHISTIGGPEQIALVTLDSSRLAAHNISLNDLRNALSAHQASYLTQGIVSNNKQIPVQAGVFLSNIEELKQLVIAMSHDKPVYLQDVAEIQYGPGENRNYVSYQTDNPKIIDAPAVTLTIGKKPGENAVEISRNIGKRVQELKRTHIPEDIEVVVTRNYGKTADDKASKLIQKLIFATLSVIVLVALSLGKREALVVGIAVILTLAITLFASMMWGFTINRVSLFALIFSIGILVDDAIVIVENIHRHFINTTSSYLELIPKAVDEVGGPTILATFTVIAALLPMAFVSGLMRPYMSPIPINASMGMLISLFVALTVTPWLSNHLLKRENHESESNTKLSGNLHFIFEKIMSPFIGDDKRKNRLKLGASIIGFIFLALCLVIFKVVIMKMLPFDNKDEFQVIVKLPEGKALEDTNAALKSISSHLIQNPEVKDLQLYAGTASPIGFNGLVRQYYLRQEPYLGDIQVNLKDKKQRNRTSHEIARDTRSKLEKVAKEQHASIQVVEVPPGPPVLAPIVAEIYGPSYPEMLALGKQVRKIFEGTSGIVDIDDSIESSSKRYIVKIDRNKASLLGVSQADISWVISVALDGEDTAYLHTGHAKYPIPIRMQSRVADKSEIQDLLSYRVRSQSGQLIPISELVEVVSTDWQNAIHHKDLLPVVYVNADMAGKEDSPLYGMFAVMKALPKSLSQYFIRQPAVTSDNSIKWDGEWQITYETFRDMGAAYAVGLVLIYLLLVAQFHSYVVPLIIMTPIPLTLIGVLPGHALLNAPFTATSMIGMIALAGIIVRNSILLVDFIDKAKRAGHMLERAVVDAATVRARPIILTGLAAALGALFILDDPIFNGLAISLIFGILVSTMLTLVIIPLVYYCYLKESKQV